MLLYVALMRDQMSSELPNFDTALSNPASFPRAEILKLYYPIEDMRNTAVIRMEKLPMHLMPEKVKSHMLYSIHSLNIVLATLAGSLVPDPKDAVRILWQDLSASKIELKTALSQFRECLAMLGSDYTPSILMTDDEWIKKSQWTPSAYVPRVIEGGRHEVDEN